MLTFPGTEWPVHEPEDGVDVATLRTLLDEAFGTNPLLDETLAFCAVHQGAVVSERYGATVTAQSTLISWSMAKSITNALVAMMVGDGLIAIDEPLGVWDDDRRIITWRHLLAMSSGLAFTEDYVDDTVSDVITMLFGSAQHDTGAYAMAKPLVAAPGSLFNYSSGTTNIITRRCADLLGGGTDDPKKRRAAVETYLQERLFDPLQMASATAKFDGSGSFIGSSFVYATAQDFARFGYLYLADGTWNDRRLLPDGWVTYTGTPVTIPTNDDFGYGAHWWLPDGDATVLGAHGYEGQYIWVIPSRDLVLVRLGKTPAERKPQLVDWMRRVASCFPSTSTRLAS